VALDGGDAGLIHQSCQRNVSSKIEVMFCKVIVVIRSSLSANGYDKVKSGKLDM
jgi:hypothetical protein